MGKSTEGYSFQEVHGSGSHHGGGGVGQRAGGGVSEHAAKTAKQPAPYGGVYKKADYDADQAQSAANELSQANAVPRHIQDNALMSGESLSATDYARKKNDANYALGQSGNSVAAGRVQDTDAAIAGARGDAPGTEYAETGGSVNPVGSNMAPETPRRQR